MPLAANGISLIVVALCAVFAAPETQSITVGQESKSFKVTVFGTIFSARGGGRASLKERLHDSLDGPANVMNPAQIGEASTRHLESIYMVAAEHPDVVTMKFTVNDAVPEWTTARMGEAIPRCRC